MEKCIFTDKTKLSFSEAKKLVNGVRRSKKSSGNIPKRFYWCERCGSYHVTHFKRKRSKGRKIRMLWR